MPISRLFPPLPISRNVLREPACAARGTPPRRNAWIDTAIANCPASIVPSAAPRSTTDDLRPAPTLPDRSDQWLLTRPWYFRLSSFERSRARSPRAPTCAPDQRRVDTIAFICLRTRNVPPFAVRTRREGKNKRAKGTGAVGEVHRSTAVPLKFYGFRSGRERVQAEDSKDYFRVTKRRWK